MLTIRGESEGWLRRESGQAATYDDDRGQRPTAGWASNTRSRHFIVQPLPPEFCRPTLQSARPRWVRRIRKQSSGLFSRRTPEHACEGRERGRCPAAQAP